MNPSGSAPQGAGSVAPPGLQPGRQANPVNTGGRASDAGSELLGRRIRAAWIDLGVLAILFVVLAVVFGGARAGSSTTNSAGTTVHNTGVSVSLTGAPLVIFLIASLLYYLLLEARSGQTIGKRLMNVRVVTVDGGTPDLRAVTLRTVGRIVDVLPVFYLVGLIAVKQRREPRQRLGDRIAHTTVSAA